MKLEVSATAELAGTPGQHVHGQVLFAKPEGQANVLYGTVTSDKGKVLSRFSLAVSGRNGAVVLRRIGSSTSKADATPEEIDDTKEPAKR